jgi:hypothetical protein
MRPTWGQVRQFCIAQGYKETRSTHFFYTKVLADRRGSRTMVSFGVDGETIPSELWRLVWRRQLLLVSEEEFWNGLDGGPVQYDIPPTPEPQQPLPDYLQRHLRDVLHWPEERIAQTTRDEAQELLNAWYARELRDP